MKGVRRFRNLFVIQLALIPVFMVGGAAQPGPRRTVDDIRRVIANDTFRELMKKERDTPIILANNDPMRAIMLKQLRDDFKSIQDVNNRMMSAAWAKEGIDYGRTSSMLGEINDRAVRLKNTLALPPAEKAKRTDLAVGGLKDFKSALLVMDRSLMSFVTNPIFRENTLEINLAAKAMKDLEDVISYSSNLKRIAANLKKSTASR